MAKMHIKIVIIITGIMFIQYFSPVDVTLSSITPVSPYSTGHGKHFSHASRWVLSTAEVRHWGQKFCISSYVLFGSTTPNAIAASANAVHFIPGSFCHLTKIMTTRRKEFTWNTKKYLPRVKLNLLCAISTNKVVNVVIYNFALIRTLLSPYTMAHCKIVVVLSILLLFAITGGDCQCKQVDGVCFDDGCYTETRENLDNAVIGIFEQMRCGGHGPPPFPTRRSAGKRKA